MPECFFAHLGGCEGRLVKAHLIPKQALKRELATKLWKGGMGQVDAREAAIGLAWDGSVWRWMCGGPTGLGGHHGQFDAKQIRLDGLPEDLVGFLREWDLEWMAGAYVIHA